LSPHILSIRLPAENHLRAKKPKNKFLAQNGGRTERFAQNEQLLGTREDGVLGLNDARDLNHRKRLPMAVLAAHVLTPPKLLDDDLLGPELVDNLARHLGTLNRRHTNLCRPVLSRDQQDLRKDELVTRLAIAAVDPNPVAFTHAELMTAFFDYCVHTLENSSSDLNPGVLTRPTHPALRRFSVDSRAHRLFKGCCRCLDCPTRHQTLILMVISGKEKSRIDEVPDPR
jgi:hypothetical protein